jgi:uncharacterized membrane protein required for colicin V production
LITILFYFSKTKIFPQFFGGFFKFLKGICNKVFQLFFLGGLQGKKISTQNKKQNKNPNHPPMRANIRDKSFPNY